MQVAVLAGGLGTRLRPLTGKIPKCMAPAKGKPFLFYLLRLLRDRGADEIILCTGYLGEQVEAYFGNGREIGLKLLYSRETGALLGTGGALKLAGPLLPDSFLVVNGDTYLDIDYQTVYRDFNLSNALALIVAACVTQNRRCDVAIDKALLVTGYDKSDNSGKYYVNAGVMALRREALSSVKPGQTASLETDIFPELIERRKVKAQITTQRFYDIGSPAGLGTFERVIGYTSA
jgi:NDP-sugar pyrophosphorylase family protein